MCDFLGCPLLSPCVCMLPIGWVRVESWSSITVTVTFHVSLYPVSSESLGLLQPQPGSQPWPGGSAGFAHLLGTGITAEGSFLPMSLLPGSVKLRFPQPRRPWDAAPTELGVGSWAPVQVRAPQSPLSIQRSAVPHQQRPLVSF